MFTGIVSAIGTITSSQQRGDGGDYTFMVAGDLAIAKREVANGKHPV